ncbi:hypothetical protein DFH11DRAFT_376106 [Phellopilus nigrolimitatus]|nr:hypothetical protein DFH11DRAFT_376106 [Phellopilus nigrolimitatus]
MCLAHSPGSGVMILLFSALIVELNHPGRKKSIIPKPSDIKSNILREVIGFISVSMMLLSYQVPDALQKEKIA